MEFIVAANTDVGIKKTTNQDSIMVKSLNTPMGKMAMAVVCDGMGGLDKGELASATVINAFNEWIQNDLLKLCHNGMKDYEIREQWCNLAINMNSKIMAYGKRSGIKLGTTLAALLVTQNQYYIINVGDSRVYELTEETGILQLTKDQTFVAREVEAGRMTPEQAETDERKNVLLQCIGASDSVYPDMFFGQAKTNAVYLLCSDGFRHEISSSEIIGALRPAMLCDYNSMNNNSRQLIELNMQRNETDNISAVLIRTY